MPLPHAREEEAKPCRVRVSKRTVNAYPEEEAKPCRVLRRWARYDMKAARGHAEDPCSHGVICSWAFRRTPLNRVAPQSS